jgi:hypothetical protein
MPGTTSLGLRYPLMGETVDATSWQNLANDIDALMTSIKTIRDKAFRTPTASIGVLGSAVNSASTVLVDQQFTIVHWDTNSMVNLGVNNDRITVPAGVWYVRFTCNSYTGTTTSTYSRVMVRDTLGNQWGSQSTGSGITGGQGFGPFSVSTVILANQTVGIKGSMQWTGTGGPAVWGGGCELQVYRLREAADV